MMKLLKYVNFLLIAVLSLVLFGCDGHSDDSNLPPSADGLEQNLDYNEDGTFNEDYIDNVTLNVWSVIGAPDKTTWENLIREFNIEYDGKIKVNLISHGHEVFYTSLENTKVNNPDEFPDVVIMHNEKTIQYAADGYFYAVDDLIDAVKIDYSFDQVYDNIERTTIHEGKHYGIPMDAHGYLTNIRQDIIKKNELGFDGNTRFIPESKAEYETLLQGLRDKADAGELWTRDINKGANHEWKKANASSFYPSFMQSTDPDGLSALYANGGSLLDETQTTVKYNQNEGFMTYVTDQVARFNNRLMGDGTATAMFGVGNTVMFSEGPWYVSQQFDGMYNNSELTRTGLGVTAEDAADPVYSRPYVASHPKDWWTLEENMDLDTAGKWYGNGHSISITRECKSLKKIAAALVFAHWYTQELDVNGEKHNLTTWCSSGHVPAWKNVYESEDYKAEYADNMTLRALGDPADIMAMEGLVYETTVFNSLTGAISSAQTEIKGGKSTIESVTKIVNDTASSLQQMLEMMNEEEL